MPRYKLRTLLILLAVAPPMLAGVAWLASEVFRQGESDCHMTDGELLRHYGSGATEAETPDIPLEPTTIVGPVITVRD